MKTIHENTLIDFEKVPKLFTFETKHGTPYEIYRLPDGRLVLKAHYAENSERGGLTIDVFPHWEALADCLYEGDDEGPTYQEIVALCAPHMGSAQTPTA